MLEYMLVRQIDNPIIQASREQKSLRWIVLDEAHTYVGSQAQNYLCNSAGLFKRLE
ncbi:hypothetical protein JCM19241_3075 [Vibrio ishigakensis]|uniref:Uncharacterized protein n=1 Tax=Vibrio ishigakensis TaxID=1481914 RepID=A0A0B8Q276_9VIBR|nr:hypothetical protein JCM19241_3075 [Vibrio ishigakensis]